MTKQYNIYKRNDYSFYIDRWRDAKVNELLKNLDSGPMGLQYAAFNEITRMADFITHGNRLVKCRAPIQDVLAAYLTNLNQVSTD